MSGFIEQNLKFDEDGKLETTAVLEAQSVDVTVGDVDLTGDSLSALNTIKDDTATTKTILSSTSIGSGISQSIYNAITGGAWSNVASSIMGVYNVINGGVMGILNAIHTNVQTIKDSVAELLSYSKKGTVTTALNAITTTTISATVSTVGYNAVLISFNTTDTGSLYPWNVKLQGKFTSDGTFMDIYDNNGNQLTMGNASANMQRLFIGIPDYIQIVATEVTDGATVTIRVQPINV